MAELRTRMPAREAIARIRRYLGGPDAQGHTLATEALVDLEAFVDDMLHDAPIDYLALQRLLANATWEWREDWGCWFAYHGVSGPVADALNWTCSSCRDDVGWADWTSARKDKDGVITLHIECGHCGATYAYDSEGNELDD